MKSIKKMMRIFAVLTLVMFAVAFAGDFKAKAADAEQTESSAEDTNDSGEATKGKALGAGIATIVSVAISEPITVVKSPAEGGDAG